VNASAIVRRMGDPSGWVLSEAGLTLVFVGGVLWGWRTNWNVTTRRVLATAALFYFLAGLGVVPLTISRLWAAGYGRLDPSETTRVPTAVVVLSAGNNTVHGRDDQLSLLNPQNGARVLEAARVFKLLEPELLITSGGERDPETNRTPSALIMFEQLVRLGVPASRIVVESKSLNTRDHATIITPMLRARNIERLVLVTSDLHMRRALGTFRATGWSPIAAAAPEINGFHRPRDYWMPGLGLRASAQLAHELLGVGSYIVRGWWRT